VVCLIFGKFVTLLVWLTKAKDYSFVLNFLLLKFVNFIINQPLSFLKVRQSFQVFLYPFDMPSVVVNQSVRLRLVGTAVCLFFLLLLSSQLFFQLIVFRQFKSKLTCQQAFSCVDKFTRFFRLPFLNDLPFGFSVFD
jgi:hypothetical protein